MVEINSETDFVAKDESFRQFVRAVAQSVLEYDPDNLESLSQMTLGDGTIETARQKLIGQVGENVSIRRFEPLSGLWFLLTRSTGRGRRTQGRSAMLCAQPDFRQKRFRCPGTTSSLVLMARTTGSVQR